MHLQYYTSSSLLVHLVPALCLHLQFLQVFLSARRSHWKFLLDEVQIQIQANAELAAIPAQILQILPILPFPAQRLHSHFLSQIVQYLRFARGCPIEFLIPNHPFGLYLPIVAIVVNVAMVAIVRDYSHIHNDLHNCIPKVQVLPPQVLHPPFQFPPGRISGNFELRYKIF